MIKRFILPFVGVFAASAASAAETTTLSVDDIRSSNETPKVAATKNPLIKPDNQTRFINSLSQTAGVDIQLKPIAASVNHQLSKGLSHQRYQQTFRDIEVWGQQAVLHSNQAGTVTKLNGSLAKNIAADLSSPIATTASFSESDAIDEVKRLVFADMAVSADQLQISQQQTRLIIYIDDNSQAVLAYYVNFFYQDNDGQVGKPAFIIDANNQTVLKQWDALQYVEATGPGGNEKTGLYEYGDTHAALDVTQDGETCTLENENVKTVDLDHSTNRNFTDAFAFTCSRNTHKAINGAHSPLNDAHAFGNGVFAMFKEWYDIAPLKSQLILKAHYGDGYDNAFWDGSAMTFGDGGSSRYPFTVLDVVGHEVAHGFTEQHSGLIYYSQSGGMNESFSDITGEAVEYYLNGSNDWLVGGHLSKTTNALRYFIDPTDDGRSIAHADDFYTDLDVHYSSGVFNRAFYLLSTTAQWDIRKAFDVFVAANQNYWTSSSTFVEGACGVINAADDANADIFAVDKAFGQVGVWCDNYPQTDIDGDLIPDIWEVRHNLDPANADDAALDADNDGLTNLAEFQNNTLPDNADTDGDNLTDGEEVNTHGTNPLLVDTDGDKFDDSWEVANGFDPLVADDVSLDSDSDSFSDWDEFLAGTNPRDAADFPAVLQRHIEIFAGAELPDGWSVPDNSAAWEITTAAASRGSQSLRATGEVQGKRSAIEFSGYFAAGELKFDMMRSKSDEYGYSISVTVDGYYQVWFDSEAFDWQSKSVTLSEGFHTIRWLTHSAADANTIIGLDNIRFFATDADTDADGIYDLWEYDHNLDYTNAADAILDNDNDGLNNLAEFTAQSDPNNSDSDDDGLSDGVEVNTHGTSPIDSDSDHDGMPDGWEVSYGLDPLVADANADTDGDGVSDYQEYLVGTLPNDANSAPAAIQRQYESFETGVAGDFLTTPADATGSWVTTTTEHNGGSYSLTATVEGRDQIIAVEWTGYFDRGRLSFDYKTDIRSSYNYFYMTIDNYRPVSRSGSNDWRTVQETLSAGVHTLRWEYKKRYDERESGNAVWLDNILFIANDYDGDNDGINDQWEYDHGLDFTNGADALLDNDSDGLTNLQEFTLGTDLALADTDGDGLTDGAEVNIHGTDPNDEDSDNDKIPDGWEISYNLDPLSPSRDADSDGDGISDLQEFLAGTIPTDPTSAPIPLERLLETFEGNSFPTFMTTPAESSGSWATTDSQSYSGSYALGNTVINTDEKVIVQLKAYFSGGIVSFDYKVDSRRYSNYFRFRVDNSSAINISGDKDWTHYSKTLSTGVHTLSWEYYKNGDKQNDADMAWLDNLLFIAQGYDGDNDGMADQWEYDNGLDFTLASDASLDGDKDGLTNLAEFNAGTDITKVDTDDDGLSDSAEVNNHGTDPLSADSDNDNMPDAWELAHQLDPLTRIYDLDTDGDGITDYQEYLADTLPNDATSYPPLIERMLETFESNTLPEFLITPEDAGADWQINDDQSHTGSYSLKTSTVDTPEQIIVQWSGYFKRGLLRFDYKVNTQAGSRLRFYVDNSSGYFSYENDEWDEIQTNIYQGFHTLRWVYDKKSDSGTDDIDSAWIDNLLFMADDYDGDNDGMADLWEHDNGLDFTDAADAALDTDNDGLLNLAEFEKNSDVNNPDTDGDGLSDGDEVNTHGTNPTRADSDSDGMPDNWELSFGLDPLRYRPNDDTDDDGISDLQEYRAGTLPNDATSAPIPVNRIVESFEDNLVPGILAIPEDADGGWVTTDSQSQGGSYSLSTDTVATGQKVAVEYKAYFNKGRLNFDRKIDTRHDNRYKFYLDGYSGYDNSSGVHDWKNKTYHLSTGVHTLRWEYNKISDSGDDADKVWIDNLQFIAEDYDGDNDGIADQWEHDNGLDFTDAADAALDPDEDGLNNLGEFTANTDLNDADSDDDGLTDGAEVNEHGSNPNRIDGDNDGMPDLWEVTYGLDPSKYSRNTDTDGDGISDYQEFLAGTVPSDGSSGPEAVDRVFADFDDQLIPDFLTPAADPEAGDGVWAISDTRAKSGGYSLATSVIGRGNEVSIEWTAYVNAGKFNLDYFADAYQYNHLRFYVDNGSYTVSRGDRKQWQRFSQNISTGLHTFRLVYDKSSDNQDDYVDRIWIDNLAYIAHDYDGDNDGIDDQWEYDNGLDFTDAADATLDPDNDGLNNLAEFTAQTDLNNGDTDGDGLSDGDEVNRHRTNPTRNDSDNDGMPDGWEISYGLNPLIYRPFDDTDGDGVSDFQEFLAGTLPNDSSSAPVAVNFLLETFENNTLPAFLTPADDTDAPWFVSDAQSYDGSYSLATSIVEEDEKVIIEWTAYFIAGTLSFEHKSDLSSNDRLNLYVDGYYQDAFAGEYDWRNARYDLPTGMHTIRWEFENNHSYNNDNGISTSWIDNLLYVAKDYDGDNDGIADLWEYDNGLDHTDDADALADKDRDGLINIAEFQSGTDANERDSDGDGIVDGAEVITMSTDPLKRDTDNDGMADLWEVSYGLNALLASADIDSDDDGVTNLDEMRAQSNPVDAASVGGAIEFANETFDGTSTAIFWTDSQYNKGHWLRSDKHSRSGDYAFYTGGAGYYDTSGIKWSGQFKTGHINFDVKLVDNHLWDRGSLQFIIDGSVRFSQQGQVDNDQDGWVHVSIPVSETDKVLEWKLSKRYNVNPGNEAFLDNIVFIADGYDGDNDGMADQWELDNGLDFTNAEDTGLDNDNDGLTNLVEYQAGTDADNADTDGDEMPDGYELAGGLDPLDGTDASGDPDGDGLTNFEELALGTNPSVSDTDGDGVNDKVETDLALDPLNGQDVWIDADADRLPLVVELLEGTDSTIKDNDVFSNNRLLIQQAYVDMQQRFAQPDDISFWLEKLDSNESSVVDVYGSLLEPSALESYGFIGRVYQAIMARDPDVGGMRGHLNGLARGISKQQVVDTFVQSNEFVTRYGSLSNSDFVNLVYQNVLGRAADEAGFNNYLTRLDEQTLSRADLMLGFIDSGEYIDKTDNNQRVGVLNLALTGHLLNPGKRRHYSQLLAGAGGSNSVLRAILSSNAYRQNLVAVISAAGEDSDEDGIPDGIEFVDGTDVAVKDNDISGNDRLFVKQVLRDLTGEQSSYQAVSEQVSALALLGTRDAWIASLLDLSEFKNQRQAISRLYFTSFLRGADYAGLMGWINHYEAGMTLAVMAGHFAASGEFQDRYGSLTNDEFVNLVYQNVLGREADEGGFANWKDHLDSGRLSRGDMMVEFSESGENTVKTQYRDQVVLLFNLMYRRPASETELNDWLDRLGNGIDIDDLISQIINDSGYLSRFN